MFSSHRPLRVILLALLLAANAWNGTTAQAANGDWLRGSGKDLEIRLHGKVVDASGAAATDAKVACGLYSNQLVTKLEPTFNGNEFEVWIPVNSNTQFSMWLMAASSTNKDVAFNRLNAYDLRQAAIDGIQLTLQTPTRHKRFLVQHAGRPVAQAAVKIELGFGIELRATTDADGVAHFDLLPDQKISQVTAWTEDYRIGGFSFGRQPTHDPDEDEFVVELSKCRPQRMRMVDEQGVPVPGVEFNLQVATPSPSFNFLGANEHSRVRTGDSGEVIYRWFPDWKEHFFYADFLTSGWVLAGNTEDGPELVGDTYVFKLKRCRERKQIVGQVTSADSNAGGFFVTLQSFQGEQENHSDSQSNFTDPDGSFRVDVLPDARYCAWVLDARWVGNIIDLIPYSLALNQVDSPNLTVSAGQAVEVQATVGGQHAPYANLEIYFCRRHDIKWLENGKTQRGMGGPQWWATTDDNGRVTTRTLPGKLDVSVYTPKWRTEQSIAVLPDETTKIAIHRESSEKRTLHGRIAFAEGITFDPQVVTIQTAAVDGNVSDQQTPACRADGTFSFETLGSEVAVFASTQDGRLAGAAIVKSLDEPFQLVMQPTLSHEGQLVDVGHRPLVGHRVVAYVRVQGDDNQLGGNPTWLDVKRMETRTDQLGNYTLDGVPSGTRLQLYSDAPEDPSRLEYFEEAVLQANETRTRRVTEIGSRLPRNLTIPLAERFQASLRDAAAGGYRPLMIVANDAGPIAEFVNDHFVDPDNCPEVSGFVPITVLQDREAIPAADLEFLSKHAWPLPEPGHVLAVALEPDGAELGRFEIDIRDPSAVQAASDFIDQHAPPRHDAAETWAAAFADASRSNRRVLARVSGRYCGPCFSLSRWLDKQHDLLEKDYVLLKIDATRDKNAEEYSRRITRGKQQGIPFFAIFDPDELLLIDSTGPSGNIGFPGHDVEGQRHLRKMLTDTRQNLTDAEIDALVESLGN